MPISYSLRCSFIATSADSVNYPYAQSKENSLSLTAFTFTTPDSITYGQQLSLKVDVDTFDESSVQYTASFACSSGSYP